MAITDAGAAPLQLYDYIPEFSVLTTRGPIRFWPWADGHWVVIASHPRDFTAVCSSELAGLARAEPEFAERGVRRRSMVFPSAFPWPRTSTAASRGCWA
ncbi:MAG: hypothetical protein CVT80_13395 [Alphaproteobacteria bacterium HGW-Alphaproteobacteria-2]|nr:MAG: hypothetical protein CVT80_13395 [Alphaproteobacteria bacterium HGW-Alphaproteobacteria-2]